MPSQHALLSPSAAHRWLHCTPSMWLARNEDDQGSDYAREGTLAHAHAAKVLKDYLQQPTPEEDAEIAQLADYESGEMAEHVQTYTDYVLSRHTEAPSTLIVEKRYDLGAYVPEAFGTSDATIIRDGELEICDLKYGKGVRVDADDNPQLKIYALGALDYFAADYDIHTVRVTIVQPRLDHLSTWTISTEELQRWAREVLQPAAALASKGDGEACAGDWCKFCRVKPKCKALAQYAADTLKMGGDDPRLMQPDDIADILPRLSVVQSWLSATEEHALALALQGQEIKGYKIVEGRSLRKITNPEAAAAALISEGYDRAQIYRPEELQTLTGLEKMVGKKKLGLLIGDYITKPQGKPTLVPLSDKRAPLNRAADDFADF